VQKNVRVVEGFVLHIQRRSPSSSMMSNTLY